METKWVGQALERTEDRRLMTRAGHFIDDLSLPGLAHAAYVRSPHARARIRHIDVRRALDHPGVYAVLTGADVAQLTRSQRGRVPLPNSPKVYALADQQVRYVGEPVVGVAAVDRATAEDAADLVGVEYDPLPPVLEPEEALRADAPLVFEEVGSNILWHNTFPYGDVEGAFAQADTVVNERVTIHRYASTPLETFGVMAQFEPATQSYTIWGHTQQPAQDLHVLAAALGISPGKIRMIVPPMGGSFGNKVRPLFIVAAALLACKAGRPVKWIEDRRESLLALGHAADGIMEMSAAVKRALLRRLFRGHQPLSRGCQSRHRQTVHVLCRRENDRRSRARA
jgi:aerobic carbon-monoxide dehydrogenase large subunit